MGMQHYQKSSVFSGTNEGFHHIPKKSLGSVMPLILFASCRCIVQHHTSWAACYLELNNRKIYSHPKVSLFNSLFSRIMKLSSGYNSFSLIINTPSSSISPCYRPRHLRRGMTSIFMWSQVVSTIIFLGTRRHLSGDPLGEGARVGVLFSTRFRGPK